MAGNAAGPEAEKLPPKKLVCLWRRGLPAIHDRESRGQFKQREVRSAENHCGNGKRLFADAGIGTDREQIHSELRRMPESPAARSKSALDPFRSPHRQK